MRAWFIALAAAGCGFSSAGTPSDAPVADTPVQRDAPPDTPPDAPVDTDPGRLCLGNFLDLCVAAPSAAVDLMPNQTINTSNSKLCVAFTSTTPNTDVCVIAGTGLSLPAMTTVTVVGSRPLVLLSSGVITIDGTIDAASHRGRTPGPAADRGPCPTDTVLPTTAVQGAGGWGGSFGSSGGNGGGTPSGGVGGKAGTKRTITALAGGCPGGSGAPGTTAASVPGGHGGGAVMLVSAQGISITGVINASGAGGDGGGNKTAGGGGGGGAGGMIVLDAPSVNVAGQCFANGGGGGESSSTTRSGAIGAESTAPTAVANGGTSAAVNGHGGNGAFSATASTNGSDGTTNTNPPPDSGGGGGGGGGGGIIKVISSTQVNTTDPVHVAPPPS